MAYLNGQKILLGSNVVTAKLPIDQNYSPESENAQSGKAVAQAISTISGDKAFEKIATITVAPDTDGTLPTKIIFSADDNGLPFELTDLYCNIKAGITNGATSRIQVKANNGFLISNCNPQFSTSLRYWYFRFDSFGKHNGGIFSAPTGTMGSTFPSSNTSNGINLVSPINQICFNRIPKVEINIITSGGQWIADSTFELWGVRA